jgi:hypothetical protein
MAKPTRLFLRTPLLPAVLLPLLPLAHAASTPGALAPVSLRNEFAYSTARPCAAACLIYNGIYACQVAGYYYDLGVELACGRCGPINNCYCSTKFGSSATSYISSCVSQNCARSVDSWPEEVTSMLELYDGYCATANVMPASVTKGAAGGATATKATGGSGTTGTNPGAGSGGEGAKETAPALSEEGKKDKEGLSQSDIIALAASLGVGIPSLLIALITLCVQLRKRKRAKAEKEAGAVYAPATTSNTALALSHYPAKPAELAPARYEPPPPTYTQPSFKPELEANPYPVNANANPSQTQTSAYPAQHQYAVHQQYPASHQYPTQQYQ